jgi:hypothetical protein
MLLQRVIRRRGVGGRGATPISPFPTNSFLLIKSLKTTPSSGPPLHFSWSWFCSHLLSVSRTQNGTAFCARGNFGTWHSLHLEICARGNMSAWQLVNVAFCAQHSAHVAILARGILYMKQSVHVAIWAHGSLWMWHFAHSVIWERGNSAHVAICVGRNLCTLHLVPWHSLYKHSLYVTKFIRTFFIQDRCYTGQSLYRTNFIRGQNLYEDKVYTETKFIRDKVYTGQSLYGDKVYTRTKFIQTFFILHLN